MLERKAPRGEFVLFLIAALAVWGAFIHARRGPTPPPATLSRWPGRGVVWVPDRWNSRRALFWKERPKDSGAVVFAGDSITEFWGSLLPTSFPSFKVANRGINDDTSRGLLFRLQEDVLDLNPRAIVILIGTNDLDHGGSPALVAENTCAILDAIRKDNPETPVVLSNVLPRNLAPAKFPKKIQELNARLRRAVVGRPNVALLDSYSLFVTPEGSVLKSEFPDLLHPNASARARWAALIERGLGKLGVK